jgi:hypothetical protein
VKILLLTLAAQALAYAIIALAQVPSDSNEGWPDLGRDNAVLLQD